MRRLPAGFSSSSLPPDEMERGARVGIKRLKKGPDDGGPRLVSTQILCVNTIIFRIKDRNDA